jgi:hypothetical protein
LTILTLKKGKGAEGGVPPVGSTAPFSENILVKVPLAVPPTHLRHVHVGDELVKKEEEGGNGLARRRALN